MLTLLLTPLRVAAFALLIFMLIRSGYYLVYSDYFDRFTLSELARIYLVGSRFDLSIAMLASLPFVALALLPFRFRPTRFLARVSLWALFPVLAALFAVNVGDLMYFGEVYRHAGREVLLLGDDYPMLFEMAFSVYLPVTLGSFAALGALAFAWHRLVVRPSMSQPLNGHWAGRTLVALLALLLTFLGARGVITGKPLSTIDAFAAGGEKQAALALNGAFAVIHNTRKARKQEREPLAFFSDQQLEDNLARLGWHEQDPFLANWYQPQEGGKPRNLVLILLESWSFPHIDGLSGTHHGATPFIDELLKKSRVWDNFFAAGQRSIEGIQAILTSVPVLPSQPALGWGLEQNRMTRLAQLLSARGYETHMVQTSNRRSFHMDGIAAQLGFGHYSAKEDIPLLRQYPQEVPLFGWDYDGLMYTARWIDSRPDRDAPFFAFFFTGTTHHPFPDPGAEFHLRPHEFGTQDAYLNTLRYSDWSIEQFMHHAEQQDWYANTVFVFLADHTIFPDPQDPASRFRVPFFIFTPDGSVAPGRESGYASQYDVLPTLMTLLNIDQPIASFGRSLLARAPEPSGIVAQRGSVVTWLAPEGTLSFSAQQGAPLQATGRFTDEPYRLDVEQRVKTMLQWVDWRLNQNLWLTQED
ncbi:MAG TPA: LTA synthase family protein [Pseudomonas sp.]|nr:LTA synthase family protein [Pseudomonas sp.]